MHRAILAILLLLLAGLTYILVGTRSTGHRPKIESRLSNTKANESLAGDRLTSTSTTMPEASVTTDVRAEPKAQYDPRRRIEASIRMVLSIGHPRIELSIYETKILTNTFIDILKASGKLKSRAAKVQLLQNGDFEVFIPARPEEAEELQNILCERLSAGLSPDVAAKIIESVGDKLAMLAFGYGAADERYTIGSRDAQGRHEFTSYARVPDEIRTGPRGVFLKSALGGVGGIASVDLDELLQEPRYLFLAELYDKK